MSFVVDDLKLDIIRKNAYDLMQVECIATLFKVKVSDFVEACFNDYRVMRAVLKGEAERYKYEAALFKKYRENMDNMDASLRVAKQNIWNSFNKHFKDHSLSAFLGKNRNVEAKGKDKIRINFVTDPNKELKRLAKDRQDRLAKEKAAKDAKDAVPRTS